MEYEESHKGGWDLCVTNEQMWQMLQMFPYLCSNNVLKIFGYLTMGKNGQKFLQNFMLFLVFVHIYEALQQHIL